MVLAVVSPVSPAGSVATLVTMPRSMMTKSLLEAPSIWSNRQVPYLPV